MISLRGRPVLVGLLLVLTGCGGGEPVVVAVGATAPSFELTALDGGTFSSRSLSGRPAVLAFWATWCQPCLKDIPELNSLAADDSMTVLAIALDAGGEDVIRPYLAAHDLRASILLGNEGVFRRFAGSTIPYTLVLDAEQTIRAIFRGPMTRQQVLAALDSPAGGSP